MRKRRKGKEMAKWGNGALKRSEETPNRLSGDSRLDVLIHAEQVARVVLRLHEGQALEVLTVTRLQPALRFVIHHEIDVRPAEIVRMHGLPVCTAPRLQG